MSAKVIPFPQPEPTLEQAWQDYVRLNQEVWRNPRLETDRAHVDARLRAFARYRDLYLAEMS